MDFNWGAFGTAIAAIKTDTENENVSLNAANAANIQLEYLKIKETLGKEALTAASEAYKEVRKSTFFANKFILKACILVFPIIEKDCKIIENRQGIQQTFEAYGNAIDFIFNAVKNKGDTNEKEQNKKYEDLRNEKDQSDAALKQLINTSIQVAENITKS